MSNKGLAIKTTVGELQWINISGKGRDYEDNGVFKYFASIMLTATEGKKLENTILSFYKESGHYKETGKLPFTKLTEGKDAGKYVFKFSTKTTWTDGNPKVVEIYNSKGKEITESFGEKKIAGCVNSNKDEQSTGCIGGTLNYFIKYGGGCVLYLDAIQLVKFIEYKKDDGADFDDNGEGYTGQEDQKFESVDQLEENLAL
jgi:hypothetical protein